MQELQILTRIIILDIQKEKKSKSKAHHDYTQYVQMQKLK